MQLHTIVENQTGPVMLWGMFPHRTQELELTAEAILAKNGSSGYTLIAFQADVFAGAASCSGSLWYPEFLSYVKENAVGKPSKKFYLSLGGKESHTKNLLMASIADRTRECVQLLREYHQVKYELNSGGHFADPGKRLAKAVEWLLTNT